MDDTPDTASAAPADSYGNRIGEFPEFVNALKFVLALVAAVSEDLGDVKWLGTWVGRVVTEAIQPGSGQDRGRLPDFFRPALEYAGAYFNQEAIDADGNTIGGTAHEFVRGLAAGDAGPPSYMKLLCTTEFPTAANMRVFGVTAFCDTVGGTPLVDIGCNDEVSRASVIARGVLESATDIATLRFRLAFARACMPSVDALNFIESERLPEGDLTPEMNAMIFRAVIDSIAVPRDVAAPPGIAAVLAAGSRLNPGASGNPTRREAAAVAATAPAQYANPLREMFQLKVADFATDGLAAASLCLGNIIPLDQESAVACALRCHQLTALISPPEPDQRRRMSVLEGAGAFFAAAMAAPMIGHCLPDATPVELRFRTQTAHMVYAGAASPTFGQDFVATFLVAAMMYGLVMPPVAPVAPVAPPVQFDTPVDVTAGIAPTTVEEWRAVARQFPPMHDVLSADLHSDEVGADLPDAPSADPVWLARLLQFGNGLDPEMEIFPVSDQTEFVPSDIADALRRGIEWRQNQAIAKATRLPLVIV
jgi:hypothetical protein